MDDKVRIMSGSEIVASLPAEEKEEDIDKINMPCDPDTVSEVTEKEMEMQDEIDKEFKEKSKSESSTILKKDELDPVVMAFNKMAAVEEAFKIAFGESVHIITKQVRAGGTSNNIYVPKKYKDNPVTLIIWDKIPENTEGDEE